MNPQARRLPWTIAVGVFLLLLTLALAFLLAQLKGRALYGQPLPVYGQVADFTLTNQSGNAVSLAELRGRVWVVDVIFTRCPGPCLRMTKQMKELQDAIATGPQARLVSLTTDPEFDTPQVLTKYAERFGADTHRWMFLTGTKKQIGDVAVGSLKFSAMATKPEDRTSPDDLFVHSTVFVVVDRQGRLRGIFETSGEGVDWQLEKKKILAAIRRLDRES